MSAKTYEVGEKRFILVNEDEIRLFEEESSKAATFTYPRWAQFVENFDDVDNAVSKLVKGEEVSVRLHIGGAWHVSVTTGYRCVDIRQFYLAKDGSTKATRTGIALRLPEWDRMKQVVDEMKANHPKVANAVPCWTQTDHFNQEAALMCSECNPFGNWFTSAGTV